MAKRKSIVEQEKIVLVMDRFATWCHSCTHIVKDYDSVKCPTCGKTFTHLSTTCPLDWIPSTIQSIRPDLIWVDRKDLE